MLGWLLRRCTWMVPTLVGITFVTFLVLDLAPVDRATMEVAQRKEQAGAGDAAAHELALARLRIRYGLVDAKTLEPVPIWHRYGTWLWNAVNLRFHADSEDDAGFRRRIAEALPVTLLLGFWALVVSLLAGTLLGSWLGLRAGSRADRTATAVLFTMFGLPDVLVATLLVLLFGGPVFAWLPTTGLRTDGSEAWSVGAQVLDLARHLLLPVLVMAIGPTILLTRFLRESVARAAQSTFAQNLEAWGIDERTRRRRLLRAGFAPVATLVGSLLPMLVTGSVVVETVFSLDGVGRLAWNAVRSQDQAMIMFLTLMASIVTLLALLLSDVLHRWIDPRVRFQA